MDLQPNIGSTDQALKTIFKSLTDDMQMCIQDCIQCAQVCEQVIQHCLGKGGMHSEKYHVRILQDCADICLISAKFLIRGSELHNSVCAVCSEVCEACAVDCESMRADEVMALCAQVSRRCADSCRKMSTQH